MAGSTRAFAMNEWRRFARHRLPLVRPRGIVGGFAGSPRAFAMNEWRRFARHRLALVGRGVIVALSLLALAARHVAPHDPIQQDLPHALAKPSAEFPLGTDQFGRCILSRIVFGARQSLLVRVIA